MKPVTINLPDDLEKRLREMSERQQQSPEEMAFQIIRRRLLMDRFRELCIESEQYARAAGFISEDEILRTIS